VESIPPTHQSSSSPVSFSPPVVKISQALLTRSTPVHVYARPVQLTRSYLRSRSVHGSRRAPQFTTHAFNPPSLPFHGFRSVPISDDRWDTRTALRTTHTPRITHSILRPSGLSTGQPFSLISCPLIGKATDQLEYAPDQNSSAGYLHDFVRSAKFSVLRVDGVAELLRTAAGLMFIFSLQFVDLNPCITTFTFVVFLPYFLVPILNIYSSLSRHRP